jgi:hypothetical protein
MPELSTIYDYMRAHSALLGERILRLSPALHQFEDTVSPRVDEAAAKARSSAYPPSRVPVRPTIRSVQDASVPKAFP